MKFSSIEGNRQKLDGGAMFGNVPKALWARWARADELNRIDLGCRSLLVETENHKILFETGIGDFMDPALRDRYGITELGHRLLATLSEMGLSHEEITAVVISHLHFDHSGGLLSSFAENREPTLLFPNATYYVGKKAFERAENPHFRDRASFIPALNGLLRNSGRLQLVKEGEAVGDFDDLTVAAYESSGHTPGMICADLRWDGKRMVFGADLIPGLPWVHLPVTMGYDRFPELLINEKKALLEAAVRDGFRIFFTHDATTAAAKIAFDETKKKFYPIDPLTGFTRKEF